MSVEKLQEEIDGLLEERDVFEEKCDTLPECEEDDGCKTCETFKKIEEIDQKVEEIEAKIEELLGEEEEEEEE